MDALADHPNQVAKSPYAYAWNNPINLTDPDGNCPKCPKPGDIWGQITGAFNGFLDRIGASFDREEGNSVRKVNSTARDISNKLEKVSNNTVELVPGVSTIKSLAVGGESSAEVSLDLATSFIGVPLDDVGKQLFKNADKLDDFNQARNAAMDWLSERGFKAEVPVLGKFGASKGKTIGMKTEGKSATGFRIEFDGKNGAHINVFSGKEKGPHFKFDATMQTVEKLQNRFKK